MNTYEERVSSVCVVSMLPLLMLMPPPCHQLVHFPCMCGSIWTEKWNDTKNRFDLGNISLEIQIARVANTLTQHTCADDKSGRLAARSCSFFVLCCTVRAKTINEQKMIFVWCQATRQGSMRYKQTWLMTGEGSGFSGIVVSSQLVDRYISSMYVRECMLETHSNEQKAYILF